MLSVTVGDTPRINTQIPEAYVNLVRLDDLIDVDATVAETGNVLVYNAENEMWLASAPIVEDVIDGGTF